MLSAQTVKLGGHVFVGGLTWVSLSRPRERVKEAVETAKRYDADCYALRIGVGTGQAGIGASGLGFKPRQVSLAAYIASLVGARENIVPGKMQRLTDWIAVLEVAEDQFAFIAVSDGAILPSGDFVGTFPEALNHLEEVYGVGKWQAIFGPERLKEEGYHNFVDLSLEALLPPAGKIRRSSISPFELRSIEGGITLRKAAILGVVVSIAVGGIAGTRMYLEHQKRQQMAPTPAPAVSEKRRVEYERMWASLPAPKSYLESCAHAFGGAPVKPAGWSLLKFECAASIASSEYERRGGTVQLIASAYPGVTFDRTGERAMIKATMQFAPPFEEELPTWSQAQVHLMHIFQLLQAPFRFNEARMPPAPFVPPEEAKRVEIVPPFWREYVFAVGPVPVGPAQMESALEFAGVRLSKIVYQGGNWGYEGIVYAK